MWQDGSTVTYNDWVDGSPPAGGDCALLVITEGVYRWHTINCATTHNFICKAHHGSATSGNEGKRIML